MIPYLKEHFGNPASANYYGLITKNAMDKAREQVADFLHCSPEEIIFTSGGTEANNMAIKGFAYAQRNRGNHIITTAIEHPAVLEVCRYLEKSGFKITILPVNSIGMVDPRDVENAITPDTIMISVMHANNETGAIQPIEAISAIARQRNIVVHTDAAQSCGKLAVDVEKLGVGLLSIAGHKLYAPKGIGVLYVKKGVVIDKIAFGAGQEQGKRPGTQNVIGIIGLGKACEIAQRDFENNVAHLKTLRDRLYLELKSQLGDRVCLNGDLERVLPNTLNLSFKGVIASELVAAAGDKVVFSAGAACHSGLSIVSSVLQAMNVPEIWASGAIRFSVGKYTTMHEIETASVSIIDTYNDLKKSGN